MSLYLKQRTNFLKTVCNNALNNLLRNLSFGLYCKPERVLIFPTLRCNLRCKHCYLLQHPEEELATDKWIKIIINLQKWLGSFPLAITGGEPLMREDLFKIINFSHKLGLVTILNTNGTLIDKGTAEKLVKSGLDIICISLDGFKEETQDNLRGKGVYKKVMSAIGYIKNQIRLQIRTTILQQNLDEILKLVEFAKENRLTISFSGLFPSRMDTDVQNNDLWPKDKEKIDWVFDQLILKKKKYHNIRNPVRHLRIIKSYYQQSDEHRYYCCQVYQKNYNIMHNGIVRLCHGFEPIGDIATAAPDAIWNSRAILKEGMKRCKFNCSFMNCRFHENLLEKIVLFKDMFLHFT